MSGIDNNSLSLAGEFAVLSQLALRNYDANLTLGRTKGVDILVSDPKRKGMYRLEVKTTFSKSGRHEKKSAIFGRYVDKWLMNKKHENIHDLFLFYCFVILSNPDSEIRFRFFIVPSGVVARSVKEQHQYWLSTWRPEGTTRKDTELRSFRIGFAGEEYPIDTPIDRKYENKWDFSRNLT